MLFSVNRFGIKAERVLFLRFKADPTENPVKFLCVLNGRRLHRAAVFERQTEHRHAVERCRVARNLSAPNAAGFADQIGVRKLLGFVPNHGVNLCVETFELAFEFESFDVQIYAVIWDEPEQFS